MTVRGDGIHTATTTDAAALADLHRRSSLVHEDSREALQSHPELFGVSSIALEAGWVRIIVRDGRITGFATLLPGDNGSGELEDLFVDPDVMRQGLGRALVDDATTQARVRGIARIEVTANPNAQAFYRSVGFVGDRQVRTRFGHGVRMSLDTAGHPPSA